jgi:Zn finger protein HypA/HybF involved in hydrogenase expression
MSKYLCWNCGLWQGDESEPEEASKLCPSCKAAMSRDRVTQGNLSNPEYDAPDAGW